MNRKEGHSIRNSLFLLCATALFPRRMRPFRLFLCALLLGASFVDPANAAITLQGYREKNPAQNKAVSLSPNGQPETQNDTTYDYVLFGRYPQTAVNGTWPPQPILWRVTEAGSKAVYLLSEKNLDMQVFDSRQMNEAGSYFGTYYATAALWNFYNNNYAYSQIRAFLSGSDQNAIENPGGVFSNATCFRQPEQEAIYAYPVLGDGGNSGNSEKKKAPHIILVDALSLLWEDMAVNPAWFGEVGNTRNTNLRAKNTAYASSRGQYMKPENHFNPWWLNGPGKYTYNTRCVSSDGTPGEYRVSGNPPAAVPHPELTDIATRPVLAINPTKFHFKSASVFDSPFPAGSRMNPYLLYLVKSSLVPTSTVANTSTLTLTFDQPVTHAWSGTKDESALAGKFKITNDGKPLTTTGAVTSGNTLILTVQPPFKYGDKNIKVDYTMNAGDSDGIGFNASGIPMLWRGITQAVDVVNKTPSPGNVVPVTGVSLSRATLTLKPGESYTLTATVVPANATNKAVTWSSSAINVATVAQNGNLGAGAAPGSATITVTTTDGKKTASCLVTVSNSAQAIIDIDLSNLGLVSGVLKLVTGGTIDKWISATPAGTKFSTTNLPDGLTLTEDGHLVGTVAKAGSYLVTLTATAPDSTKKTQNFTIQVADAGGESKSGDGGGGCDSPGLGVLALGATILLLKRK